MKGGRGEENHQERGRRNPAVFNQLNEEGGEAGTEGEKRGPMHFLLQEDLARGVSSQGLHTKWPCSVGAGVINAGPRKARRLQ